MHNVNTEALEQTIAAARDDPAGARQEVTLDGEWQAEEGAPQFRATIGFPKGEAVFEADFPPPMGGSGAAPNPLAYCFWGGLACYAMTFAQEAAKAGIEIRSLRARAHAEVDQTRALGVTENPPVERIEWSLEVDAETSRERVDELKRLADERCPGVWCVRNPVELVTMLR